MYTYIITWCLAKLLTTPTVEYSDFNQKSFDSGIKGTDCHQKEFYCRDSAILFYERAKQLEAKKELFFVELDSVHIK